MSERRTSSAPVDRGPYTCIKPYIPTQTFQDGGFWAGKPSAALSPSSLPFRSWSLQWAGSCPRSSSWWRSVFLFNSTGLFDSHCCLDPANLEYQTHSLHCQTTGTFSRSFGSIHLLSRCSWMRAVTMLRHEYCSSLRFCSPKPSHYSWYQSLYNSQDMDRVQLRVDYQMDSR